MTVDRRPGALHAVEDLLGVLQQLRPGRRQLDATRRAQRERQPELLLQTRDLL